MGQPGTEASTGQPAGQSIGSIQASGAQPQGSQPQGSQGFQAGQQQNSGGTAKRWKKKYRDRDRPRSPENPGNVASGSTGGGYSNNGGGFRDSNSHQPGNGGGFKRKSGGGGGGGKQQRGPRSFVGPMDHSYRVVNGNFAEAPPSTIDSHGNGNYQGRSNGGGRGGYQSDSQPIDYSQGRTIPIAEDAPTKIYFFIDDLFFIAKIQETARKLGVKVAFVKNDKESVAALTAGEEEDRPGLIVFDLNNANAKPLTLIPKLKTKLKRSTSIVGFLSHLQGDLKAKAVEAGCDTVMPRSILAEPSQPSTPLRHGRRRRAELQPVRDLCPAGRAHCTWGGHFVTCIPVRVR
jgi:CheY-like chemotaxis protein